MLPSDFRHEGGGANSLMADGTRFMKIAWEPK